ncbi:MAG: lipopolysaccharide biosynthesis protein [Bacteroidaceae bacterium]|nr:lipopolysaccharide biosynthesis protein [Bacteroidaceae bacterium]
MSEDLKNKTAKGLGWGLLSNGTTQLLNLVFGIVLARLLTPADYGVVGVLTVFTLIAGNLQSGGFTQGLCNMKSPTHGDYNSVFWFNILVSAALYVLLFLCAPLIADFFHSPELLWLSRFTFLVIPISALSTIAGAYMFKNMMVKEGTIISIVALLCSGTVGIVLAFMDYSYWALAWQQVTYTTAITVGRYMAMPFRPSLRFSFEPVKKMFSFSVKMMLTTILTSLSQQILTFIFGNIFGKRNRMDMVGNYSQANKWNMMASDMLRNTIAQVAQPVMAEVRDDDERSLRVLRKMIRFTAFLAFPAMFGLALVSEEFILTTIGEKWLVSAGMLRVLAIAGSTIPLYALLQNVAISHGRSDIFMWLNVVQILVQIGLVLLLQDHDIETMVLAVSAFTVIYLFVWHFFTKDMTARYSLFAFLKDIMPFAILASLTMLLTWLLTEYTISNAHFAILFIAKVIVAAALYTAFMFMAKAEIMKECIGFIRRKKQ